MNELPLDTLGYYEPGFLHLKVNINEDITDLNKLIWNPAKKSLFSTIFHEYIHFLQEVTSTYGLMNCIIYIDFVKYRYYEDEVKVVTGQDNTRLIVGKYKITFLDLNAKKKIHFISSDMFERIYRTRNTEEI